MVRIFLTGYMGAGKTTLGKAFARKLNVPFIDLDMPARPSLKALKLLP